MKKSILLFFFIVGLFPQVLSQNKQEIKELNAKAEEFINSNPILQLSMQKNPLIFVK